MMFNKKPFNKKDGETRICKECGVEFHTMHSRNVCKVCVNKQNRMKRYTDLGLEVDGDYRGHRGRTPDLEGIGYEERRREYYRKSRWLEREVKNRSDWQEFFRNEFERIMNDKPLWESLTRDSLGMAEGQGKRVEGEVGRPKKSKDRTLMTWDDFEREGWQLPEDD